MKFVSLDFETANDDMSSVCQIGLAYFENGQVTQEFKTYINPESDFGAMQVGVHGITSYDVIDAPTIREFFPKFIDMIDGLIVVHYTHFERTVIKRICEILNLQMPEIIFLDAATVVRRTWESFKYRGYGLANVANSLNISFKHHDALEDAIAAGKVLNVAIEQNNWNINEWIDKLKKRNTSSGTYTPVKKFAPNPDGEYFGESVLITGDLIHCTKSIAREKAAELGFDTPSSISKNITLLVSAKQDPKKLKGHELSSKHRTVLKYIQDGYSIKIISGDDFLKLIGLD
ncbi:exonuclease domain-containing protein [Draconibacterium mangrovi]|uniref:exonuclease domain-containing protein n=1 Tax=Draconibacterium mangrovi TaxID=2697469 RepID=UPI0013D2C27B|nr:exonuclease domain-containing protein [Draconibacterium mangrovi]